MADPQPQPQSAARRYTILHPPLLAFFSKTLYQDVAWRWRGTNLLYLFLLLAACWVPPMVKLQAGLSAFVDAEAPKILDQVPPIQIRDGKLSADVPQPHTIEDPDSGKPIAIIDTTGEITSLDGTDAIVLATETRIIARKSPTETRIWDISQIRRFDLDRARLGGWLRALKRWMVVLVYPLLLLSSFIYRAAQALLYALIGLLFAKVLDAELSYPASIRLAIIAVTPAILLDTLRGIASLPIPAWSLICFAIAMLYLLLAIKWSAERPPNEAPGLPEQATTPPQPQT